MKRPGKRLIIVSLISLAAGYAISWGIMVGILGTEYRLYGFGYLSAVAFLVAVLFIVLLDSPLKLKVFDWPETEE